VVQKDRRGVKNLLPLLLAALVLVIALVLRLHGITSEGLWLDEFFSAELSTGRGYADQHLPRNAWLQDAPDLTSFSGAPGWTSIWSSIREDTHPPLYFLLLRAWRAMFGSSDASMRGMSVLFSMLAVVGLMLVAVLQFNWSVAIWSALLMALATPQIVYGQEARNNPMVLALALLAAAALIWIEKRGATFPRLLLFGAGLFATMLTHYYCVGVVAAMTAYVALTMRSSQRVQLLITLAVTIMLCLIVWGPILLQQGPAFKAWHIETEQPAGHLALTLQRLTVSPMRQLTGVFTDSIVASVVTAAICIGALVMLYPRRELWLWWMWLVCVLAVLLAHDLRRTSNHLLLPKYAILTSPAIFLIIAAGLPSLMHTLHPVRYAAPAAAAIICLWYLPAAYEPKYGNWSAIGDAIMSRARPGDVVVFAPGHRADWSGGWTYLAVTHYVHRWPMPVMILNHNFDDRVIRDIKAFNARSAFVVSDAVVNDPTALIRVPHCGTVWQVVP
jgi:uncharacterized membrane protein